MKKRRQTITLNGPAANAFIAQSHDDTDLAKAVSRTIPGSMLRSAVIKEILRRGLEVPGVCARCGCTDDDCSLCESRTGQRCAWTNEAKTVCSACLEKKQFHIEFFGWGKTQQVYFWADSYADATYQLGLVNAMRFIAEGFPHDFALDLSET